MTETNKTESNAAYCPHVFLSLIYAEPNGRWECGDCREVFAMRDVFAAPTVIPPGGHHA